MTIASLLAALLSSCASQEKLARLCAESYPCDTSTIVRERVVNDTIIEPSVWVEYLDTTQCPPSADTILVIKEVKKDVGPIIIIRRDTILDTVQQVRDPALISFYENKISALQEQLSKQEHKLIKAKAKKGLGWLWWLPIGLVALAAIRIIRRRR